MAVYRLCLRKYGPGKVLLDEHTVVATGFEAAASDFFKGREYTTERSRKGRGQHAFFVRLADEPETYWQITRKGPEDRSLRTYRISEKRPDGVVVNSEVVVAHRAFRAFEQHLSALGYRPEQITIRKERRYVARVEGDDSRAFEIDMIQDRSLL